MLKVHATRVSAPTAENQYATKWQVAVTDNAGRTETFDAVDIPANVGHQICAHPDSDPTPHVYVECWGVLQALRGDKWLTVREVYNETSGAFDTMTVTPNGRA